MRSNRVPEHLMGTRQGLFFLLTSGACPPVEDRPATQDLPKAAPVTSPARASAPVEKPHLQPVPSPERDGSILNELLASDDFRFNL
ncbi:MAG: hypothetical protein ACQEVT_02895 [Pseudomonadota bacterium]|uniref:hypothetical protein n=1 Tax=Roseovarius salincola TaxID=2978479 RepID=UPI0022A66C87|nr:hypothetical protein [Roseovarius sp. EGI FJ00037]MCZ0811253.1 hypothetical protein [Roseovarius sp. EGI FJ00037]